MYLLGHQFLESPEAIESVSPIVSNGGNSLSASEQVRQGFLIGGCF
jgi:hypothetical protein